MSLHTLQVRFYPRRVLEGVALKQRIRPFAQGKTFARTSYSSLTCISYISDTDLYLLSDKSSRRGDFDFEILALNDQGAFSPVEDLSAVLRRLNVSRNEQRRINYELTERRKTVAESVSGLPPRLAIHVLPFAGTMSITSSSVTWCNEWHENIRADNERTYLHL